MDNQDIQTQIIKMAEKRNTSSTISGQQLEMTGMSKSIIEPHKVAPLDLEMLEDYLEKRSMSPRQEGFNPYLAIGEYTQQYYSMASPLSGIPDYFPLGNPVFMAPSIQGNIFINQITGEQITDRAIDF